ncbi:MAG: hypothetical protein ACFE91_08910 [Promethearchaeota archaeon]
MRKKFRIFSVLALYTFVILAYVAFFFYRIDSIPLFLSLTIGSVAVLSTSTIYTIIQSQDSWDDKVRKKKSFAKKESIKKIPIKIFDDYIEAMPSIEEYIESNESYKDKPIIDKFIFSFFSQEELDKINLLGLSKMDKILFIREMLYFNSDERKVLIENMLKNRDKVDEDIIYTPPINPIDLENQIRVYVRSLLEVGEKTKIIIIERMELISLIKERIGRLFDYDLESFLLSSGGILLDETLQIKDYDISEDDEIALIPSRKEKS